MASVAAKRSPRRVLTALVLAFGLTAAAGCTHPCLELSRQLCDCADTELEREQCIRRAENDFKNVPDAQLEASADQCAALLETCDCRQLDTEEGKEACGLARP